MAVAWSFAAPPGLAMQPESVANFTGSLGINTHVYALSTPYGDLPAVVSALAYLGITHVRDNPPAVAAPERYLALAAAGIGLDLVARSDAEPNLPLYERLVAHLDSIEGGNEVNAHPNSFFYHGLAQIPAAMLLQRTLHDEVKANPQLRRVPIALFTTVDHGMAADNPPYGDAARDADLANAHAYPRAEAAPPDVYLAGNIARAAAAAPGAPLLLTEFGYFTWAWAPHDNGLDAAVQARWLLDAVADNFFLNHVRRQYIYELVDQHEDGAAPDKENHFGVFDLNWQPKPSAVALHDLHVLLGGGRAATAPFAPREFTVTGLPPGAHTGLLQNARGDLFLFCWAEPPIWDAAHHIEMPAPDVPVTVTFPGAPMSLAVVDPLTGTAPLMQTPRANKIAFTLGADLLLVEARPAEARPAEARPAEARPAEARRL